MVFPLNLSDSKSPQVFSTLLCILIDFKNAVVWTVSTCPLISKSSSLFTNILGIIIIIIIIISSSSSSCSNI